MRGIDGRMDGRKEGVPYSNHTYILNNDYIIIQAKNGEFSTCICELFAERDMTGGNAPVIWYSEKLKL